MAWQYDFLVQDILATGVIVGPARALIRPICGGAHGTAPTRPAESLEVQKIDGHTRLSPCSWHRKTAGRGHTRRRRLRMLPRWSGDGSHELPIRWSEKTLLRAHRTI